MVGRGKLLGVEMDESQIEGSYPLERIKVQGSLEACYSSHILLLTKEAHPDVIPELGGVRVVHGCDSVLEQSCIVIALVLDD